MLCRQSHLLTFSPSHPLFDVWYYVSKFFHYVGVPCAILDDYEYRIIAGYRAEY